MATSKRNDVNNYSDPMKRNEEKKNDNIQTQRNKTRQTDCTITHLQICLAATQARKTEDVQVEPNGDCPFPETQSYQHFVHLDPKRACCPLNAGEQPRPKRSCSNDPTTVNRSTINHLSARSYKMNHLPLKCRTVLIVCERDLASVNLDWNCD